MMVRIGESGHRRQPNILRLLAVALLVSAPGLLSLAPASAQSAAACAAAKAEGRVLAGCPGARRPPPATPVPKADRRPPTSRDALSPAALAMRAALGQVSERDWLREGDDSFLDLERRVFAMGSFSDLTALARSGNRRAQHFVARAYWHGQFGVSQNKATALEWHQRAAALGDARSQTDLGYSYSTGDGIRRNDAEAIRLYNAAANQGFALGQFNLGYLYQEGRGVPVDYQRAMRLYRQAADQNLPLAIGNIAFLHANGQGVPQNYDAALSWATRAAAAGNAPAQRLLGLIYFEGRGSTARNAADGLYWLRRAVAAGDDFARDYLSERGLALE